MRSFALGFSFCSSRLFNDVVNLLGGELVGAFCFRFFTNNPKHLRLRCGQPDVVPDAEQYRARSPALFDYERPAFVLHSPQELSKIRARLQRWYHDRRSVFGLWHPQLSTSIIRTVQFNSQSFLNSLCSQLSAESICNNPRSPRILIAL